MQAEDHLGRLPPSRLTPAGFIAVRPHGQQAISQLTRLAEQVGRTCAGLLTGWRGALRVPQPGPSDPGGSRVWWPRRQGVRGLLLFGAVLQGAVLQQAEGQA